MKKLIIKIDHDECCDSPTKYDGWKVYSFSSRHNNYKNMEEILPPNIGLRQKLKHGTAFLLSYYEHGLCSWMLKGSSEWATVPDKQWDAVGTAGIMIWEEPVKNLGPKTFAKRREDAKARIDEYTNWCNGACYYYSIEDEDGKDIDCCGGFIGEESVAEAIAEHTGTSEEFEIEVTGSAAWIAQYHKLQKEASLTGIKE